MKPLPPRPTHSGLKVASTNSSATATVTAWEKMSQILRMSFKERWHDRRPRDDIDKHLRRLLEVDRFKDYGPNGLQVEGKARICKIVSGVTASLALIDAAIDAGADALLVHHGLFWRGQDGRLTGWLKARVARLMQHELNLFAYHLPLDAHAELGQQRPTGPQPWAGQADERFGEQALGFIGDSAGLATTAALAAAGGGRGAGPGAPLLLPGDGRPLRRMAWCTGGAQGYFEAAIEAGCGCLPDRRDLRAAGPPRTRDRCGLPRLWAPCHRALRRARGGRSGGRPLRPGA